MLQTDLKQAPFGNTLMGAIRGAADHFGLTATNAYLYGATGQAFLMNIHRQLCPSGPYCWNREPFFRLLRNVGLSASGLGFYHSESSAQERDQAETELRDALDHGAACLLANMEYQLITGYDDTGFLTAQPWPGMDYPPAHLTFGSWEELGDEIHMDFYVIARSEPADRRQAMADALAYAVDLWRDPTSHTSGDYGVGQHAYNNWIGAVRLGFGGTHGNWWNGTVWAESRAHAPGFLEEIGEMLPDRAMAERLAHDYATIADALGRCSSRELDPQEKVRRLEVAAGMERSCIDDIETILARMP